MRFTQLKLCVIHGETSATTRAQKVAIMSLLFHYMRKHLLPLKLPEKKQRFKLQMVRPSQHQRCLEDFMLRSSGVKKENPFKICL